VTDWKWIRLDVVYALHDVQLAQHGGMAGMRDAGMIESAMARPVNIAAYGDPDAAALAAAYGYSLAKNHGFLDGNKRTAWVVARLFLSLHGYRLSFDKTEVVALVENLAGSTISEEEFAEWFRQRLSGGPADVIDVP
jgi:death-on-curing protein